MDPEDVKRRMEEIEKQYPEKFLPEEKIFEHIRRGDRIFIGTGCGLPQYLLRSEMITTIRGSGMNFSNACFMSLGEEVSWDLRQMC